jgi:hypothetical protein
MLKAILLTAGRDRMLTKYVVHAGSPPERKSPARIGRTPGWCQGSRPPASPLASSPDHMTADFDTDVDLAIKAIAEADAAGVHLDKSDVTSLETDFITHLEAGDLPIPVAEQMFRLLEREAQRLDKDNRENLVRRGRLEEAWEQFSSPTGAARTSKPPARSRKQPAGTLCAACG